MVEKRLVHLLPAMLGGLSTAAANRQHPRTTCRTRCRYTHPKQVLVSDGLLSPDMAAYCSSNSRQARRQGAAGGGGAPARSAADENGRPLASFVFPHGSTVLAQPPAVAFLSSGQVAHPCNMTVGGWRAWLTTLLHLHLHSRSTADNCPAKCAASPCRSGLVAGRRHQQQRQWQQRQRPQRPGRWRGESGVGRVWCCFVCKGVLFITRAVFKVVDFTLA